MALQPWAFLRAVAAGINAWVKVHAPTNRRFLSIPLAGASFAVEISP